MAQPSAAGRWVKLSLLAWVVVAGALFLLADPPPPEPPPSQDEVVAMQRGADIVARNAVAWQANQGDLTLPWNEASGHLAIVIDDIGRELHVFELMHSLRFRLTFSVLPGSVYAAGAQLRLRQDRRRYREILLHLPMEPLDASRMDDGPDGREIFLLSSDSAEALRGKLEGALRRVPTAIAVNNHMGSKLTADRDAMLAIMPVLRQQGMFYLDSRTAPETVAEQTARAAGVVAQSRHVFLDNERTPEAMRVALDAAADRAQKQPTIAIGHPSVELYELLAERLLELHAQGIGVYPLSWVVERSPPSPAAVSP